MDVTLLADACRLQQEALDAVVDITFDLQGEKQEYLESLIERRRRLVTVLAVYQTFIHQRVYDPMILSSDAGKASEARSLKVACIVADERFRQHVYEWPLSRIQQEWRAYTVAVRLAVSQLKRHIAEEAVRANALLTA